MLEHGGGRLFDCWRGGSSSGGSRVAWEAIIQGDGLDFLFAPKSGANWRKNFSDLEISLLPGCVRGVSVETDARFLNESLLPIYSGPRDEDTSLVCFQG